jgi:hypothetical protein
MMGWQKLRMETVGWKVATKKLLEMMVVNVLVEMMTCQKPIGTTELLEQSPILWSGSQTVCEKL